MGKSKQWHKHKDGVWHKVERKPKTQSEKAAAKTFMRECLGIPITRANGQA